ncbi:cyclin-dependent kinase 3 [Carpediemonas membranifera]|uniref:cyclin-dependent kinase n=1 Tax=Carpediemonas membranifera TaxID=201153 RepID=A0A8J6EAW7_9EUKA|nr:cyclin-dependent kinase 3 [Carpediemonas membranifera]|eukprot:KAG9395575.1 cyclin-dependent kinase 3 [Carpediemonas membranifera]
MVSSADRYLKQEKLGSGAYGDVYKAKDLLTGELVALKMTNILILCSKTLEHDNVIRLLDVVCDGPDPAERAEIMKRAKIGDGVKEEDVIIHPKVWLIFELCETDMRQLLDQRTDGIELPLIKTYLHQLLTAVDACHSMRILHRDLKPANLMLNGSTLKVGDFGLVRAFSVPMRVYTHEVVTLWYRAPEILLGSKHYTTSVDTWSVGAIMAEIATGELFRIFEILGTPTDQIWAGVTRLPDYASSFPSFDPTGLDFLRPRLGADGLDLLGKLLEYDPAHRISAAKALEHPFFADLNSVEP